MCWANYLRSNASVKRGRDLAPLVHLRKIEKDLVERRLQKQSGPDSDMGAVSPEPSAAGEHFTFSVAESVSNVDGIGARYG